MDLKEMHVNVARALDDAERLCERGNPQRALSVYKSLLPNDKLTEDEKCRCHFGIGTCLEALGEWDQSEEAYEALLALSGRDVWWSRAHRGIAKILFVQSYKKGLSYQAVTLKRVTALNHARDAVKVYISAASDGVDPCMLTDFPWIVSMAAVLSESLAWQKDAERYLRLEIRSFFQFTLQEKKLFKVANYSLRVAQDCLSIPKGMQKLPYLFVCAGFGVVGVALSICTGSSLAFIKRFRSVNR